VCERGLFRRGRKTWIDLLVSGRSRHPVLKSNDSNGNSLLVETASRNQAAASFRYKSTSRMQRSTYCVQSATLHHTTPPGSARVRNIYPSQPRKSSPVTSAPHSRFYSFVHAWQGANISRPQQADPIESTADTARFGPVNHCI
jgi:hypothetical protein